MSATEFRLAITTTADRAEAERLAHDLVRRRLAACVNILPSIRSVYRWQEKIENGEEQLLLIKTHAELLTPLREAIKSCHSYEVPEFLVFEIADGSADYLAWLASSLGPSTSGD